MHRPRPHRLPPLHHRRQQHITNRKQPTGLLSACRRTPKPSKQEIYRNRACRCFGRLCNVPNILTTPCKKPCFARTFDFVRKTDSTVPSVRRRVRCASLWRSFDFWQFCPKKLQADSLELFFCHCSFRQRFIKSAISAVATHSTVSLAP